MASLIENMAPEYTTDGAKAGNYYMHSKLLYLCKSDCSGLFDESNFEQIYLSDLLRGTANSNLGVEIKDGVVTNTIVPALSSWQRIGYFEFPNYKEYAVFVEVVFQVSGNTSKIRLTDEANNVLSTVETNYYPTRLCLFDKIKVGTTRIYVEVWSEMNLSAQTIIPTRLSYIG